MSETFQSAEVDEALLDRLFGSKDEIDAESARNKVKREMLSKFAEIYHRYPTGQSADRDVISQGMENAPCERFESD